MVFIRKGKIISRITYPLGQYLVLEEDKFPEELISSWYLNNIYILTASGKYSITQSYLKARRSC